MRFSGEIKIITGSALFAFIPVCVMIGHEMSIYGLICGRLIISAIVLFILQKNRMSLFVISKKQFIKLTCWSLFMLGAMICYFLAIKFSSIAISSSLLGIQPLIIVFLAFFILKERISFFTILAALATLAGILCITGITNLKPDQFFLGEMLAIFSAFLLGLNFIFQKKYLNEFSGQQLVFYQSLFQIPFLLPIVYFNPGALTPNSIFAILLLGIVCSVISYTLIYNGIKQVDAQKIGVLQSIEYVLPVIIGIFFYNEKLSTIVMIGVILIIASCIKISLQPALRK